jgi:hypothetical protein
MNTVVGIATPPKVGRRKRINHFTGKEAILG